MPDVQAEDTGCQGGGLGGLHREAGVVHGDEGGGDLGTAVDGGLVVRSIVKDKAVRNKRV